METLHVNSKNNNIQECSKPRTKIVKLEGEPGQNGGETGALDNLRLDMLMNMFGGLGTGGLTAPNRSNVPPEEQYATQLSQLQEMGFFDTHENIRALIASLGNVHAAVEQLLGNPGR
ncbi:Ubiquitin domain-containing protein DSK2a [Forsythia ovata]|uniref:Ubiquitin domain-containing protein DSK2a n=1 Tax=Forsythia ovata TaxID=205694 RepID=A0ABD1WNP3_9LAMI